MLEPQHDFKVSVKEEGSFKISFLWVPIVNIGLLIPGYASIKWVNFIFEDSGVSWYFLSSFWTQIYVSIKWQYFKLYWI